MSLRFIIIIGVLILAEYYSAIAVRSALRSLPAPWKTSLMTLYIVMTVLAWLGFVLFRQINWAAIPHLLRNIYIAFVLGFIIGKVLVLIVMFIDDVRRLFVWLFTLLVPSAKSNHPGGEGGISRSTFLLRLALLLGGASVAGFVSGVSNRYKYHVRRVKLKFDNLPTAFKGIKIVQLSDIHTGSFDNHNAVAHGIAEAMNEKADIIFFTGDLVNNHAWEVDEKYKHIFSQLKAPLGVYSILGNHDYGDYTQWPSKEDKAQNLQNLKNIHKEMGWQLLANEHTIIQKGEDKLAIIGVENWSAKLSFTRYGNMRKAYDGLERQNIPVKILLSHDPSHWDAEVRPQYPDVQLTLSGHTHGMQFGIESKWLNWSPVKYVYPQWAGLYQQSEQYLYVNRGFGFLGYPGRLGILPEITVFELA